jgi:PAS domain S-box-containing protein
MSDSNRTIRDELEETNRFLDAIVENIPDMVFVKRAEDHAFVRFNRAGEQLLGWTREELIGKTDHDFYPKEQADFFHAKDRETLQSRTLVDVPQEEIDTRYGRRWLHTKKVPIFDAQGRPKYLLGISEDITQRKASEERALAAEHELAMIVRSAREAIIAWAGDGTIVTWNPAAAGLFGVAERDAIGAQVRGLLPPAIARQFDEIHHRLADRGELPLYEAAWTRRDGRELEVAVSMFVIRELDGRPDRYAAVVRDLTELARLRHITELLSRASQTDLHQFVVTSPRMQQALAAADLVARDPIATVLLLGETGVGKGWLARRIHARSPRADRPFFELNCASLSPQLVESELFGHERGAFTGATSQKRGIVEAAEGGTLFLDEIGELPPGVQAQLLTFLDARTYRRVGGTRMLTADVRLLAATNVELKRSAERGTFRRDLYYRLSVVPIEVPPLRERREEIPSLARSLATDLATHVSGRRRSTLSKQVIAALQRYDWPGNVRELRNVLERAIILSRGGAIEVEHLAPELRDPRPGGTSEKLEDVERAHILRVLEAAQGNRTHAADILGISRSTLKRKLAEYGVADED